MWKLSEPELRESGIHGYVVTEQKIENAGNLWVWPGTHRTHAAFFRERGPDALVEYKGYPKIELPEPSQFLGGPGDVILGHYMLGHNIGGNYASERTRQAAYFRLRRVGHEGRWRECLCDELLEFDPVRAALDQRSEKRGGASVMWDALSIWLVTLKVEVLWRRFCKTYAMAREC